MHWINKAITQELDINTSLIINELKTITIDTITEIVLYIMRLFKLIIGFFSVSAGLYLKTINIPNSPNNALIQIGKIIILQI